MRDLRERFLTAALAAALVLAAIAGGAAFSGVAAPHAAPAGVYNALVRSVTLVPSSPALTATGNGSAFTGFARADLLRFQADCPTVSGTTPSATFKLQESIDAGTSWNDLVTLTAITTSGGHQVGNYAAVRGTTAQAFGDQLRAAYTISGTTPSFTCTVTVLAEG